MFDNFNPVKEEVILVNEQDQPLGVMEKMEAHVKGRLHRAFSVFIFNDQQQMLLQQRAVSKYHSGGLWTNACCSHPRPGEDTLEAAHRRLFEEMGLKTELKFKTAFLYRAEFENQLTEHEFDHIFVGYCNEDPVPDREEAEGFQWLSVEEIKGQVKKKPEQFTAWFKIAVEKFF